VFLKDIGEISRARSIFFVPFFGSFVTFIIVKSDYIIKSNIVIQIEVAITFLLGVVYAQTMTRHLSFLETIRFILSTNDLMDGTILRTIDKKQTDVIKNAGPLIQNNLKNEGKIFKLTMWSLWITTGSVLQDIYFGGWLHDHLTIAVPRILSHWL
jgi:hypothetical protein